MGGYIECLPCPVGWLCSQGERVPPFTAVVQDDVDGFKSLSPTPTGWSGLASKREEYTPRPSVFYIDSRHWYILRVVLSVFSPLNATVFSSMGRLKNGLGTRGGSKTTMGTRLQKGFRAK